MIQVEQILAHYSTYIGELTQRMLLAEVQLAAMQDEVRRLREKEDNRHEEGVESHAG